MIWGQAKLELDDDDVLGVDDRASDFVVEHHEILEESFGSVSGVCRLEEPGETEGGCEMQLPHPDGGRSRGEAWSLVKDE